MSRNRPIWIWLALCLVAVAGCAKWRTPALDFSRYRDPRAVDIDNRMSSPPPTGETPSR